MKRILCVLATVIMLILMAIPALAEAQYIADRSIQDEKDNGYYLLFFSIQDRNRNRIKAPATVNIRIENGNQIVYSSSVHITESNYSYWTSKAYGTQLLASIKINKSDIQSGTNTSGKVYFKVYLDEGGYFDESVLTIYDLPKANISGNNWIIPTLPMEYIQRLSDGTINGKLMITNISFEKMSNFQYKITFNGYITECREGHNIQLTAFVFDDKDEGVDIRVKFINNPKKGESFSITCTTVSLPYGPYTLKFSNSTSTATPSPTPVPDLSKYLGIWYANEVYHQGTGFSYDLGVYYGTTITINNDHTISVDIPGFESGTGVWDVKDDKFYVDGKSSDLTFYSSNKLLYDLGDNYYLVLSHTPPINPTATPEPTATPAPSEVPTLKGDVNADGIVDGRDLLRLARYIAGDGVSVNMAAADVNGDGNMDGRDVLRLAKQLAGG